MPSMHNHFYTHVRENMKIVLLIHLFMYPNLYLSRQNGGIFGGITQEIPFGHNYPAKMAGFLAEFAPKPKN